MASNAALSRAKDAKKDEFYTQYEDIQNELNHYEKHFPGKTVLCNCDDPFESNFCKFFLRNFNYLKLKRLICTSYTASPVIGRQLELFDDHSEKIHPKYGYVMDVSAVPMENGRGVSDSDIEKLLKSKESGVRRLQGDGDFRSEECIEYLKQADIVVTNPPFSLFREYIALLVKCKKNFLIIGNQNAITYKDVFPLLKNDEMWLGYNNGQQSFLVPDTFSRKNAFIKNGIKYAKFGNICWFTNLEIQKRHEKLVLYKHYYENKEDYPKYDNYDAIEVSKVSEIPCDYLPFNVINDKGVTDRQTDRQDRLSHNSQILSRGFCNGIMGVPITFLDKYNPEQFEIIGATESEGKGFSNGLWYESSGISQPLISKERKYKRLFIRRKM